MKCEGRAPPDTHFESQKRLVLRKNETYARKRAHQARPLSYTHRSCARSVQLSGEYQSFLLYKKRAVSYKVKNGGFRLRFSAKYSASLKALAVNAFLIFGILLIRRDVNGVERTEVLVTLVVLAVFDAAMDRIICGTFVFHTFTFL